MGWAIEVFAKKMSREGEGQYRQLKLTDGQIALSVPVHKCPDIIEGYSKGPVMPPDRPSIKDSKEGNNF